MEDYPPAYYEHNLPLVFLSGLVSNENKSQDYSKSSKQENGSKIDTSSPECEGKQAEQLLQQFLQHDGTELPWNSASLPGPSGSLKYKIRTIGRTYSFPPRKAAPMPQSPSAEVFDFHNVPYSRNSELHSPLSPLSPTSPICPDGIFTPLWLRKHQQQVPSILIACFNIVGSGESNNDEQIKSDINAIRGTLSRSGFKTKFAAVLLSDQSILQAPGLEDRLASIRRTTTLDSKTGLFFMPPMSSVAEIETFVKSVLTPMQPLCVEYYRDLTKHARRKKARGGASTSVSSPMGVGSQALSTLGWNVRYEMKQGVFAEFRQEMDVAERHYATAIDDLFNPDGVLEFTPSWSPRWTEARLLCDCLALRVLRCQLWNGFTTGALQSWTTHKNKMRNLVDRRGKGSQTHSWSAWETRWAEIMAQLLQRANVPAFQMDSRQNENATDDSLVQFFASPEKAFANMERLPPFDSLHHPGYWHRRSTRNARTRRKQALAIPDEDRLPPGQSPASSVAKRTVSYDSYLVPDPHEEHPLPGTDGYDHIATIIEYSENAVHQFAERGQSRMADFIKLDLAVDFVEMERYEDAMRILLPLWNETSWRTDLWLDIFSKLLHLLLRCALRQEKAEALVGVTYELLSVPRLENSLIKDLTRCLEDLATPIPEPLVFEYQDTHRISPVGVQFAFESKNAYVGEPLACQLILTSGTDSSCEILELSSVCFTVGDSTTVTITHSTETAPRSEADNVVNLNHASDACVDSFHTSADLKFQPGQRRIFNVQLLFREPGPIRLSQAAIQITTDQFKIEHVFRIETLLRSNSIFVANEGVLQRMQLPHLDTTMVTVLPKPPKAQIHVQGLRKQYYTDELVVLKVELFNGETDVLKGRVKAQLQEDTQLAPGLQWSDTEDIDQGHSFAQVTDVQIPEVEVSQSYQLNLLIQAPIERSSAIITVEVEYSLLSDSSSSLRKMLTFEMDFVPLFEAKFNFGPLLYPGRWPSYFDPEGTSAKPQGSGIPQLWRLSSQLRSLASENVFVHETELSVDRVIGDSKASATEQEPTDKQVIRPGNLLRSYFELATRKLSLDDRRATTVETTLAVTWSRDQYSRQMSTTINVPQLTLAVSEPRVLCVLLEEDVAEADAVLHYHIENPSAHFLTFAVTMEASEDFAFSGPKYRTLSLAPLSRHRAEYRITLYDNESSPNANEDNGRWIWPSLQVVDSYYNKQLRVHAGGPSVKTDEKGSVGVWVPLP